MNIRYAFGALILFSFTTIYKINEKEVERILSTLASDEMEGRSLGSEGIKKAANFIADEFESIGLNTLKEEDSFFQNFYMESKSIEAQEVDVNGETLPASSYFFKLSSNSLSWTSQEKPEVLFIHSSDDFQEKARAALNSKLDLLVIVAKSHQAMFGRYQPYFSRPSMGFEENEEEGGNIAFVLMDTDKVESLRIEARTVIEKKQLTNVAGIIEGKRKNEIVLFSGHYDHLGVKANVDGDSIYNGANDDASGVTAVIELARYFKSQSKPERTLVFVAFTAEEVGGYGSTYFSKQMNPDEIVAMFNIEMIGKESKQGLNSAWMTGWDKSNLGDILQENLGKVDFKFFEDPYPEQDLFYRSDNATLARLGVPAHSISTTQIDIDKNYHQLSDEVETLDITNITNTIKAIAIGSQGIVDGTQTPTRVDPSSVRD